MVPFSTLCLRAATFYLLQHILHDWDDENCLKILRGCCAAMGSSSTLLVVENIMPESPAEATNVVMLDIHMMAVLGGRERTFPEYEALLTSAGFAPRNSGKLARKPLSF